METIFQLSDPSPNPSVQYKKPNVWKERVPQGNLSGLPRAILLALNECYCMTADMLSRYLSYQHRYTQQQCQRLTRDGLLEATVALKQTQYG